MFVMSEKFVKEHKGRIDDISIYGQESNQTTWKLCRMNLAIQGIDGNQVKWNTEGSFLNDVHKDLKADFILANPPFNDSDWSGELLKNDSRWKYGVPPAGNANFAWMQHMIYHLSPKGIMALVLANGSLSSNTSNEGEIRKNIIENDLVDCIVALPKQLFYNTGIPACIWFISRKRAGNGDRKRTGEILFIDASEMGYLQDRVHRMFTEEDMERISETYRQWRSRDGKYEDIKGFCKSATLPDIEKNNYVLTPGRYVGIPDEIDDGIPFKEKMGKLTSELKGQMEKEKELNEEIKKQLNKIGYDL
jgi:type I restriction enzyme M protein